MNSAGSKIIRYDSLQVNSIWGKDQTSKFPSESFEMHKYFGLNITLLL